MPRTRNPVVPPPTPIGVRRRRGAPSDDGDGPKIPEPAKAPFVECPEARDIGLKLVGDYHPHLKEAKILWLFSGKAMTRRGLPELGKAIKMSDLQRYLSDLNIASDRPPGTNGADYAVILNRPLWEQDLNERQRVAAVDHLLCHLIKTPKGAFSLRDHDIEEFADVIQRHGLIFENLLAIAPTIVEAATQVRMELEPVGAGV